MEEFLDCFITYNIWVLASDHFLDTKCTFDLSRSRKIVSQIIGTTIESGSQKFSWDIEGTNNLGVMLCYLDKTLTWLKSLPQTERDLFSRNNEDFPHYASKSMESFLYKHTQLWADMDINSLKEYIEKFETICKLIRKSNLSCVRNGIDHKRSENEFPRIEVMDSCAECLKQIIKTANERRYFPNPLWLKKIEKNRYGMIKDILEDSSGQSIEINGPSMYFDILSPSFNGVWLVSPVKLSEYPNSHIIFKYKQMNEYDEYWDGYPRRIIIHSK